MPQDLGLCPITESNNQKIPEGSMVPAVVIIASCGIGGLQSIPDNELKYGSGANFLNQIKSFCVCVCAFCAAFRACMCVSEVANSG